MKNKNMYEIVILGRGGQGVKSLGEFIAKIAGREGKFVRAFPEFGPERSGAPVKAFVRISEKRIRTCEPILSPDCFLVLDEKLLADKNIFLKSNEESFLIVNTNLKENDLKNKWKISQKVFSIDATSLSLDFLNKNFPNLGILGKFIFITERISLENALIVYEEFYAEKIDQEKINLGKKVIQAGYQSI